MTHTVDNGQFDQRAPADHAATKVLVVGFGNTLRGDDGLGPLAAQQLGALYASCPMVRVIAAHQLLPELAELASGADLLILIDACHDSPPGHIHCRQIDFADSSGPQPPHRRPFIHDLDPTALLQLSHRLYGAAPLRTFVFTVGGADFGFIERLSPPVARAIGELIARVNDMISWWMGSAQPAQSSPPACPKHEEPRDA
jgi:hydrogenase maturation protease